VRACRKLASRGPVYSRRCGGCSSAATCMMP
jgi:hypothetical protein